MGSTGSKESKEEKEADLVFNPRYIAWDENGNLRYGLVHPVKRSDQLKEILKRDLVDDEDGKVWYIMDSAWIASWLAYVHVDKKHAPAPGPCNNRRLLTFDYTEKRYVGRPGLIMARSDFGGDYRRVSKAVWDKFKEFYPESGPAVTMTFNLAEKNDEGLYDCSKWTVIDFIEPPEDGNKTKKKKLFNLGGKVGKVPKEAADGTTKETPSNKENKPNESNTNEDGIAAEGGILEDAYAIDSDDDIDLVGAPIQPNSVPLSKTRNDPKVVGITMNTNYSKLPDDNNERQPSKSVDNASREAYVDNVFFGKD